MKTLIIWIIGIAIFFAYHAFAGKPMDMDDNMEKNGTSKMENLEVATFAGGCFWCTESDFEKVAGVKEAISGYTGGHKKDPTYKEVSAGMTGHAEAVQVYYDPDIVSYSQLIDVFWRHINPTDSGGQFVDRGNQYRSEIFYHNDMQKKLAIESKQALEKSMKFDRPIVTAITKFDTFYPAEEYHQNYYKKNPIRYKYYRGGSGRDRFLNKTWKDDEMKPNSSTTAPMMDNKSSIMDNESSMTDKNSSDKNSSMMKKTAPMNMAVWSKPDDHKIKEMLTPLQYSVTQKNGTERPFKNEYWHTKEPGIYVDIVSGEPLFSSIDKFDSGTGWPSFSRPLEPDHVIEKTDKSLFMVRTEVRSKYGDSHLGHLFDDGPKPTGLRYCINSAALKFIPKDQLESQGYGRYVNLF